MNHSESSSFSRLNDRVCNLLRQVQYSRVENTSDRQAVYRLRYDCYLREQAIRPMSDKSMSDQFDEHPNALVFALSVADELVASIRLHILSEAHPESPSMAVFADTLEPLVGRGLVLIDPTRFVVDANASRRFPELCYLAIRLPFMAAEYYAAENILAAVRVEHMPFYERKLRFSKVCQPRNSPQLTKPFGLMMVSSREHEAVTRQYPFFSERFGEAAHLFGVGECVGKGIQSHQHSPSSPLPA